METTSSGKTNGSRSRTDDRAVSYGASKILLSIAKDQLLDDCQLTPEPYVVVRFLSLLKSSDSQHLLALLFPILEEYFTPSYTAQSRLEGQVQGR